MGRGLFQPMHLLLILFIVLIFFGPGRLPEIGEGLGKSIRGFKKALFNKDDDKSEKVEKTEPTTLEKKP